MRSVCFANCLMQRGSFVLCHQPRVERAPVGIVVCVEGWQAVLCDRSDRFQVGDIPPDQVRDDVVDRPGAEEGRIPVCLRQGGRGGKERVAALWSDR